MLSFYKETVLTSLFPWVLASAWCLPKLSAFLTACSLFLTLFPKEVQPDKVTRAIIFLTLWVLCREVNYPNSRGTVENVYLHSFCQKLQSDRQWGGGEKTAMCRQDPCTLQRDISSGTASVCISPIYRLADQHNNSSSSAGFPTQRG